jgi:hypothetical protein
MYISDRKRSGSFKKIDLVLTQSAIVDSESAIGRCRQPANSLLIPQSRMIDEIRGVSPA